MLYTEHDKLTIIELKREVDTLSFQQIGSVLQKQPANVIYCVIGGALYGIVSMGDIKRAKDAGKQEVKINRMFTSVSPNEYMRVRKIFIEKEGINAIPILDKNKYLLGDYARWDSLMALLHMNQPIDKQYAADFWKQNNYVAFVKPCDIFPEKKLLLEKWKSKLGQMGVMVEIIERMSVPEYLNQVKLVIFTDENERLGSGTLIEKILDKEFVWDKVVTCKTISTMIENEKERSIEDKVTYEFFKTIKSDNGQNGHIFALQLMDNGSEYYQKLVKKEIPAKYVNENLPVGLYLPTATMKDFYEELYTEEYAEEITESYSLRIGRSGYANILQDKSGKYYNVKNGERLTINQPDEYDRTIFFFGPCVIMGGCVGDQYTIESFLQEKCNNTGVRYKVVNLGCWDTNIGTLDRIIQTPIKKDDIIVVNLMRMKGEYEDIDNLNLMDALEEKNVPGQWFVDEPRHCNHRVNQIFADAIYERLETVLKLPAIPSNELIKMDRDTVISAYAQHYCNTYFIDFKSGHHGTVGSIVMNCNPFTNGHRYLIEESLKAVDFLIIFVVQEDRSIFTFDERFTLVKAGVEDLPNVMVVPSGQLILSQRTFPEYFYKVDDEDLVQNVEYDITLFAEQIAPRLNITYRFVGEEPQDKVTNEYNQAMKRILPEKGINFIEIPRKENKEGIISASRVRKCLEENNIGELKKLVPKSTFEILEFHSERNNPIEAFMRW